MAEKKEKILVLLDAHAILHRAYHALPEFTSSKGEPTGALFGLISMILAIAKDLKPDYVLGAFDLPKPTYRHVAYKDYKAGRKKTDDELVIQLKKSREIFDVLNIPYFEQEGFEADDLLGTLVDKLEGKKDLKIYIASGDMDTLQLVNDKKVQVYTLKKGIKDTVIYDEKAVIARYGFKPEFLPDYKGLRGDPSDNIIGIPGIGEKTASILISKFGSLENLYKVLKKSPEKVKEAGVSDRIVQLLVDHEEEAIFSKGLATIRRDAPIEISFGKEWKEGVDMARIEKTFGDLDFRSLLSRAREFFVGKNVLFDDEEGDEKEIEKKEPEVIKTKEQILEEKETLVALWLINSDKTNPTIEDLEVFARTKNFAEARTKVLETIKKNNLSEIFEEVEKPLIPVLEKMIANGLKTDVEYLNKLGKDYGEKLAKLEKEIWQMTGEEFNVASPKQLAEILFVKLGLKSKGMKKTKGGAQSTREEVLKKMLDVHPVIEKILEHRELSKLISSYIEPIPKLLGADGRLHANFSQTGTTTGRMSSNNPNLQNIPTRSEQGRAIRRAFVAEDGFELISLDYSQIELRLAAILSGDQNLIEVFQKGEDIHTAVASRVFQVSLNEVDKEMRRRAKIINFGILYGMGVNALRENLGTSREEAQKFYNDYFSAYPTLAEYLEKTKEFVRKNGYTETLFGRRRNFGGIKSPLPYVRAEAERMAINAPIQGSSADIIKLAMVRADKLIEESGKEKDVRLVLQVHDEVVYEIKKDLVKEFLPKIKNIMEGVLSEERSKRVPIETSASVGKNFGEMDPIK